MMIRPSDNGERYELTNPVVLPKASAFLWNKQMMIHMNCRGYAVAQFMQPEPAKYAYAPNLEAKTFMQPEQPYYAHHPGRFFYIKDEEDDSLFSVPYEPVRTTLDSFIFSAGKSDIQWFVEKDGLHIDLKLSLSVDDPLEIWSFSIRNQSGRQRRVSVYPYFPSGYMSWMNQSGKYDEGLQAIVCSAITPYQKYQDYDTIKTLRDKTFLLSDKQPVAWEVNQEVFEGEGGVHNPSSIQQEQMNNSEAIYETPTCAFQYRYVLISNEEESFNLVFGAAKTDEEIGVIKNKFFKNKTGLSATQNDYAAYIAEGKAILKINTPDKDFDNYVNEWLSRQVYYHGVTNRLSTDPQTRNYMQDNMGMAYIKPQVTRKAFITALSQQDESGAMPDGVLIQENAALKYINQVPHTDHCVWLPICLKAYLDETNDYELLNEKVPFAQTGRLASVKVHLKRAMLWLNKNRDERGLNYINQGDWCDPMNMVGYKGKGVSGWLTIATAYSFKVWAEICEDNQDLDQANEFESMAQQVNELVNKHFWDGDWYARGITDDNITFGIKDDKEGRIFLNPQAWALLSGAADDEKKQQLIRAVEEQLESPYGVEMLGPPYTAMREDVGRVTQKFPGSAENGSVYNHAGAFYIYGLFEVGEADRAFRILRKMLPESNADDIKQRGQMPVFIPNYYRGGYRQFPRTAGRSSQLFNTGTAAWYLRILVDGLFGLKGSPEGLLINPQIPSHWNDVSLVRIFRGAIFELSIKRSAAITERVIIVDGKALEQAIISDIVKDRTYQVEVLLPKG